MEKVTEFNFLEIIVIYFLPFFDRVLVCRRLKEKFVFTFTYRKVADCLSQVLLNDSKDSIGGNNFIADCKDGRCFSMVVKRCLVFFISGIAFLQNVLKEERNPFY